VERLDDDGTTQTNGWVQAAALVHDANTNESFFEVGEVRAQRLLIGPEPQGDQPVTAWIDGKLRTTDHLETAAKLRTDTVSPFSDSVSGIVRVEGAALTVEGELRTDTIRARDVNGTTSVSKLAVTGSLTVGGLAVTGNPFWCAGKVGSTGAVLANLGRVSFTTAKTSLGQWTVTFATPHPSANNVVVITSHGYTYLSSSTATGFSLVLKNFDFVLADAPFHFTVLA
jgi:hypothetical protein